MRFSDLPNESKIEFIKALSPKAFEQFRYYSNDFLRPSQIVPEGNWSYFIAQCGRGWGKSLLGAHWLASKVYKGEDGLALVAPTHADIEDYIKEALEAEFPPNKKPKYIGGDKKHFICFNGVKIKCYSADKEIRGSNLKYIWLDEFCAWCDRIEEKATERFTILNKAVRKGNAQMVITTTPRPWKILAKWNERFQNNDPAVKMVFGRMDENYSLSERKKQELYRDAQGSRDLRQELYGELLTDVEGALWGWKLLDECRVPELPKDASGGILEAQRTIISVDPAITSTKHSDLTGIIVAYLINGVVYLTHDISGTYTPNQWANKVNNAYKTHNADCIIVETNQGGDLVINNLKSVNPYTRIKKIHAYKGKILRAEPVAGMFEAGKVKLVGHFSELEQEMTTFTGSTSDKSPNRLDAMVYAITELLLSNLGLSNRGGIQNMGNWR